MLRRACPNLLNSTMPAANDAVVTMPIAASAESNFRRVTRPIISPEAMPHTPAPRK